MKYVHCYWPFYHNNNRASKWAVVETNPTSYVQEGGPILRFDTAAEAQQVADQLNALKNRKEKRALIALLKPADNA